MYSIARQKPSQMLMTCYGSVIQTISLHHGRLLSSAFSRHTTKKYPREY